MPKRRRSGGFKRRKKFRGRVRGRRLFSARGAFRRRIPRGVKNTVFPQKAVVKHRYCDVYTHQVASTITPFTTFQTYRTNSTFDPYETGVGHQPLGRDQYAALYNKYCVIGSKMTVKMNVYWPAAGEIAPLFCGITVDDDDTSTPLIEDMVERNRTKWKIVRCNSGATVSTKWSAKQAFGGTTGLLQNSDATALEGTNPTKQMYYHVMFSNEMNQATFAPRFSFVVIIDYITVWFDLKEVLTS